MGGWDGVNYMTRKNVTVSFQDGRTMVYGSVGYEKRTVLCIRQRQKARYTIDSQPRGRAIDGDIAVARS